MMERISSLLFGLFVTGRMLPESENGPAHNEGNQL
jgi:hypothetical protein